MESIFALVPMILQSASTLVTLLERLREVGKQTGEWTPREEAAYQELLRQMASAPEWQPDK